MTSFFLNKKVHGRYFFFKQHDQYSSIFHLHFSKYTCEISLFNSLESIYKQIFCKVAVDYHRATCDYGIFHFRDRSTAHLLGFWIYYLKKGTSFMNISMQHLHCRLQ